MRKWIMRAAALFITCLMIWVIYIFVMSEEATPLPEPPEWVYRSLEAPKGAPAPGSERPLESGSYFIDIQSSVLHWVGKKKWPYTEYKGTLALSTGKMVVGNGVLNTGEFTIDMTSLDLTSLKDSPKEYKKMMSRLRDNFFYVDQYPTASFAIDHIEPSTQKDATHLIKGKLTIKGNTNTLTIPATISGSGKEIRAYSVFTINRTDYGIIYGEDSFFGGIGDAAIKDDIDMILELKGIKNLGS